MRRHALVLGAVVAAAVALAAAATAHANATQFSIMEDDHLLLWSGDSARDAALGEMHALGVTTVHVLVIWARVAPAPKSYQRPAVDLTDPSSYGSWAPFDAVAAGAAARGMRVLFTPTGPVPAWASDCPRSAEHRSRCKPNRAHYA